MLKFVDGNLFGIPADIRVNTVNCVGVMGKGVALQFKTRYPEMFRAYKQACEAGEVQPGKLHIWRGPAGEVIVNFPTKRHWKQPSRLEDIGAGLDALRLFLKEQGKVRVVVPALGCGHGGLDWDVVSPMIAERLGDLDADIFVFGPSASRASDTPVLVSGQDGWAEDLHAKGILVLQAEDGRSPHPGAVLSPAQVSDLVSRAGLPLRQAGAVKDARAEAGRLADQLARAGVRVLVKGFPPYPSLLADLLGESAPPILFARGDLDILRLPAIGFAGSRKASPQGLAITREAAGELARRGGNVISGYANGVDLAAHRAALEAGGATTLVLAEGILNFRMKFDLADVLERGRYLVLSEFPPSLKWLGRSAMQRNRTICGLSRALVVVESGLDGGTFAAAETAQEMGLPLFVVDFANPPPSAAGNPYFLQRGASPLRNNGTGRPNLGPLLDTIGLGTPRQETLQAPVPQTRNGAADDLPAAAPDAQNIPPDPTLQPERPAESGPGSPYPRRLIEVDLPIARISAHARREKSIRHGHISTLHIWWARRPLAACRAVICAALWPDPADQNCPQSFRDAAARHLVAFARRVNPERITAEKRQLQESLSPESRVRWEVFAKNNPPLDPADPAHQNVLRFALLDFIADFANWDNSTVPAYLETSRALTQAAHEALGGEPGTRPLVVDPFAGGGSIPLEALRVGADAFASDLNPVAVLLNKVVLEYIPKYGQKLADEVRKWGRWIKEQAEKELAEFYPKDPDGATPIAYLWARTIRCEGAGCGAEVPLMRSLWLAKKANKSVALKVVPNPEAKRVDFQIINGARAKDVGEGTVKRGSVTCPCCSYTTPVKSVREQLKKRRGGAADARLFCVVTSQGDGQGRTYRTGSSRDEELCRRSVIALKNRCSFPATGLSVVPDEKFTGLEPRRIPVPQYGMDGFADLLSPRQQFVLSSLVRLCHEAGQRARAEHGEEFGRAIQTCLAFALDRQANTLTSLSRWNPAGEKIEGLFARQAIPMLWDYAEAVPCAGSTGGLDGSLAWVTEVCAVEARGNLPLGQVVNASAMKHPLPDGAAEACVTDPPYYYSVPYSDLSDFFYVWLRRSLEGLYPELLGSSLTPKLDECIQNLPHSDVAHLQKDRAYYEKGMRNALLEARRFAKQTGIGVVVFAHSDTEAWESLLAALIGAGWCVTASWPIDTERGGRMIAQRQSVLASSIHLLCRPRVGDPVGDWRDVLAELPQRMHEWMPRLASEGVVGADAIFACLGPALEIFSRYSRVEKANGDPVLLKEYLEHVWAAVSKEALSTIFRDADASGLEPDARLTAMWLWTLGGGKQIHHRDTEDTEEEAEESEEGEKATSKVTSAGFALEFDAARKIAQGLGIHLERSESIVEVKGKIARLLAVAERTKHLFGKDTDSGPAGGKKAKRKVKQPSLFEEMDQAEGAEDGWKELNGPPPGTTILDRLHQAMILFGGQRGELLKRFLVEDGVGKDARFWKLAQSLAALYPPGTDERRWVEGVLARKKGLGL